MLFHENMVFILSFQDNDFLIYEKEFGQQSKFDILVSKMKIDKGKLFLFVLRKK